MTTGCSQSCYWVPLTTNKSGDAAFRRNKKVDQKEPVVRAQCKNCERLTWFTKSLWEKLPVDQKKGK